MLISVVKKQQNSGGAQYFSQLGTLACGQYCLHLRWVFPLQISLPRKLSWVHPQLHFLGGSKSSQGNTEGKRHWVLSKRVGFSIHLRQV